MSFWTYPAGFPGVFPTAPLIGVDFAMWVVFVALVLTCGILWALTHEGGIANARSLSHAIRPLRREHKKATRLEPAHAHSMS